MKLLVSLLLLIHPFSSSMALPVSYYVQAGTPVAVPNFILPEAGCNWAGVAGQVFDENGQPAWGLLIWVFGTLENSIVSMLAVSGGSMQMGPGGYEIHLANHLITGQADLYIQLLDVSGLPLSMMTRVPIYSTCEQNLTLVNLVGLVLDYQIYFPFVPKY